LYIWSLDHVEEDAVQITSSFFAKPPNPTLWWWANLWWDSEPRNSCDYKKRLLFLPGLEFQAPLVVTYAFLRGLLMGFCYLCLLLMGFKPSSFSFRPMFHAFSSIFKQMCDFESKTCNYAFQTATGENRKRILSIVLRLPVFWIAVPVLLTYLGNSAYHHPKIWLVAALTIVTGVGLGLGTFFLLCKLASRSKSMLVYYEQVPVERPKKHRVPVKVRWLDAKSKYCLPFPE
jgi:hypothetical protein